MKTKQILIILGTLLSIALLIMVLYRLDWQTFFKTFKTIYLPPLLLAAMIVMINIALRSLRWNLVARIPLTHIKHFWQAANIGYLGNMIYPARAGEVLKIIAIHHFVPLKLGKAVTSAVLDRVFDMITVGIFTLLILWIHGQRVDPNLGRSVIGIFILATLSLIILIIYAKALHQQIQNWSFQTKWQWLQEWLLHALESIQALRQTSHLFLILLITGLVFTFDYFFAWQVMLALGWSLPFEAAVTVGVFLLLSVSLPSAPGFIGIYQVACVLALKLYGINESVAVAYSIVMQLLTFLIMGTQGALVTIYCGFNLSQERQQDLSHLPE
jgi:uncharacterized protein (TIRG00374 family)